MNFFFFFKENLDVVARSELHKHQGRWEEVMYRHLVQHTINQRIQQDAPGPSQSNEPPRMLPDTHLTNEQEEVRLVIKTVI